MPARVHAIIVARPGSAAQAHLSHTLDALEAQSRRPDEVTVVVCGNARALAEPDALAGIVQRVVSAKAGTTFADAVEQARPHFAAGQAIWLLADDTAPDTEALLQLTGALERSPSAALAAPKLVQSGSEREIVSLGVAMTNFGRSVELAANELDQGQHDGRDDALGADIRGILIRAEAVDLLRIDRALNGVDEGLDLGVRARLAGGRVVLVPTARVAVRPDGIAAPPRHAARRAYVGRVAQLHRRLVYAPAFAVPLHWLSLLPLALWRTIGHLVGKRPASVLPEWVAALSVMMRFSQVSRARRVLRANRTASWSSIAGLRITQAELRRRLDDGHGSEQGAVSELNFFSGGGAWVVLAAIAVSIASFTSLLAWPALGGGALLPLRDTVAGLWRDAAWGQRGIGVDVVGPADPFAGVIAAVGSLWPGAPSFAMVLLWLAALPLAVLGGWFAATRVTDRAGLRIFGAVVWGLAPTFLTALVDGRPAAVLAHLFLPWLFHSAVVAHRSWGAAGAASLFAVATLACAPSLAPAVIVLWVIALIFVLARGMFAGAIRVLWLLIPAAVVFAPLVIWQLRHGSLIAVLADPGVVLNGAVATADAAGRMLLAMGFPTADMAGWAGFLPAPAWAAVLLAPLAVLALGGAAAPRWVAGIVMLIVGVLGLATAYLAVGVVVSFTGGQAVPIWPGTGLSLAWIGITGAALVALDTGVTLPRLRATFATIAALAVAVCAVPSLLAFHLDRSALTNGPESTLPAYATAEMAGDQNTGTLLLRAQDDGSLGVQVVWGASETLGAQSTVHNSAPQVLGTDMGERAVDLLSASSFDAAAALAEDGIRFVLLSTASPEPTSEARSFLLAAEIALNQRSGFIASGSTDKGTLWSVDPAAVEVAERAGLTRGEQASASLVVTLQLAAVLAALLLALPTRASRRAARAQSRIVGRAPDEPLVLPERLQRGVVVPGVISAEMLEAHESDSDEAVDDRTDGDADAEGDVASADVDVDADAEGEVAADADAEAERESDAEADVEGEAEAEADGEAEPDPDIDPDVPDEDAPTDEEAVESGDDPADPDAPQSDEAEDDGVDTDDEDAGVSREEER